MQFREVDFLGSFYTDDNLLWSSQDVCNWLPTVATQSGTRSRVQLFTPPGLAYFTQCGDGPIRGARNVEGKLFVVSGGELYEVLIDGTAVLRGIIPGTGLVSMAHNKRGYGNQLLIVNGDAGYVWDTNASTLTKITDSGFPGSVMADYLDHYLIQIEPWGRFWFNSDLDDALGYSTLDQYDAEAAPDKLKAIAANQLEAVVFGERTVEFFSNTGAATNTFQSKRIVIERGIAGRNTLVKLDNALMWLGNDGIFYRLNGYGAQPISPGPVSKAIAGLNWENAFGFTWEDKGYKVAYWTFPDGQTWGYDVTQPDGYKWHRRQSFGLDRWRLNTCTLWQGMWIGGDYRTGVLYTLDWSAQHEMGEPMISDRIGPTASANQNTVVCPYIEFLFNTGGVDWDGTTGIQPVLELAGNLPDGITNIAYTPYQYTATGGVGPYTFAIASGSLPAGLTMDSDGLVTGTPTTSANYSWTVQVTDALSSTADLPDTAAISGISWPSFGWTTYNDADAAGSGILHPVFAPAIKRTVGFGISGFAIPPYSADGGLTLAAGDTTTNGGDGDWSPTLGLFFLLRSNTDRLWTSTNGQNWTNRTQAVNLPAEPCVAWAADRSPPEFGALSVNGTGAGAAYWGYSTNGTALTTTAITANHPLNMRILIRAPGRYFAFASNTPAAANRIASAVTGRDDWGFIGSVDTAWTDAKHVPRLSKVFACGSITGTPASRKVISIDPVTQTITDVTPTFPAGWEPSGIADFPQLGLLILTGNLDASSGNTSFFTSPTGAAGTWTERTTQFPQGLFGRLEMQVPQDGSFYRLVVIRSGGLRGDGVAYSNTSLVPP